VYSFLSFLVHAPTISSPTLDHSENVWQKFQIMKCLIMEFFFHCSVTSSLVGQNIPFCSLSCILPSMQGTNTHNYWILGPFPSSGIVENWKHDVSETGSVSFFKSRREKTPTQLGPINPVQNHFVLSSAV
jgi:hypothetical protein